ncbi:MAG TPA: YtxH domain-containing protein [Vicinamibacterales bacterium]|nr:YtxH domain-containing protein [Vicinamibacterales bacterium]
MKNVVIWALSGVLLGIVIASMVVPPLLAWYTAPGGLPQGTEIQALVQIPEVIRYSTSRLIRGQLIGGAIGAALGVAIGIFLNTRAGRVTVTPQRATPA